MYEKCLTFLVYELSSVCYFKRLLLRVLVCMVFVLSMVGYGARYYHMQPLKSTDPKIFRALAYHGVLPPSSADSMTPAFSARGSSVLSPSLALVTHRGSPHSQ